MKAAPSKQVSKVESDYESSGEADVSEEVGPECSRCGANTAIYDELRTKNEFDMTLDAEANMTVEWKPSDCKLVEFLVCVDCKLLRVACIKCSEACALIGHMGYKYDGTQWQRAGTPNSEKQAPANSKILDMSVPRYDISDQGKTSVSLDEWMICGPDNKMPHFWSCPDCGKDFKFSRC